MGSELLSMSVNSSKAVSLSQRVLSGQNAVPLTKSLSEFAGRDPRPLGCRHCSTFRRLSPAGSAPVQQACWGAGGCPPHLSAPPDSGPGIPRAHSGPPRKNSQRLPAGTPVSQPHPGGRWRTASRGEKGILLPFYRKHLTEAPLNNITLPVL